MVFPPASKKNLKTSADQKLLGKASKFQNIIFVLLLIHLFFLILLGCQKGKVSAREAKVS